MHVLRKCQCKNHLTGSNSPLVCLPLQLPLVSTSPGKSTWRTSTLISQQVRRSCASMPWGIHMGKRPTSICARISSFLEQDPMKIIGFKSEKKQDFSTSAKAWIEKTLTCCVSMRRLAFLVEGSVVKAKYIRIVRFIHQRMSINFGKKHICPFKMRNQLPGNPQQMQGAICHWPGMDPGAHTVGSSTVGKLHYLKYFFFFLHFTAV